MTRTGRNPGDVSFINLEDAPELFSATATKICRGDFAKTLGRRRSCTILSLTNGNDNVTYFVCVSCHIRGIRGEGTK